MAARRGGKGCKKERRGTPREGNIEARGITRVPEKWGARAKKKSVRQKKEDPNA